MNAPTILDPDDLRRAMRAIGPLPDAHPPVRAMKVGVLLCNLGTPDGVTYWPMRRYLREFLSDRRVIETPRWLWWPILNLIILTVRPSKSGAKYASVWNKEHNESPLRTFTRAQADKLAAWVTAGGLGAHGDRVVVDWAMRYGAPSIRDRLQALQDAGCDRILLVPLYPQYSAPTTATVCDKAFEALAAMRWQPTLRVAPPYGDDPAYIDALATSIRGQLAKLPFEPEVILASFHGVPRAYLNKGDPYHCQCAKTTRLLRDALGMSADKLRLTFQSRFGPAEWLKPYTDETVMTLAKQGVKKLAIVTPGFSADCLETIEEIGEENAEYFHEHGGQDFARIACLNDSPEGMALLGILVERELRGWL